MEELRIVEGQTMTSSNETRCARMTNFLKRNTICFTLSLGLNLEPHARKYCVCKVCAVRCAVCQSQAKKHENYSPLDQQNTDNDGTDNCLMRTESPRFWLQRAIVQRVTSQLLDCRFLLWCCFLSLGTTDAPLAACSAKVRPLVGVFPLHCKTARRTKPNSSNRRTDSSSSLWTCFLFHETHHNETLHPS